MSRAAQHAVERAERRLAANQLLAMATQLESLEAELALAAQANDADRAQRALVRWRQVANEVVGILDGYRDEDPAIRVAFEEVCDLATTSLAALIEAEGAGVAAPTRKLQAAVAAALGLLARYAGRSRATTEASHGNE